MVKMGMIISRFLTIFTRIQCAGIVIIYALLFLLGLLGIVLLETHTGIGINKTFQIGDPFGTTLLGIGCAAGVVMLSFIGSRIFRFMKVLEEEFRILLGELGFTEILIIALVSSIAEETFFRGALQPLLGLTITSLIFGLLHFPMNKRFVPWTLFATGMGFLLGMLYIRTGTVITPIMTHTLVNLVNLLRLTTPKQKSDKL